MNDKLRVYHADICIRCESVRETAKHNYIRWCVCSKCSEKLKEMLKGYEENGLYLTSTKKCDLGMNHCITGSRDCYYQSVTDGECVHYRDVGINKTMEQP